MLDRIRHRHELEADDPGAPPGFLIDLEDDRSPACADPVPDELWDHDGDPLARGAGEAKEGTWR
jgi:hypothetical protein